MLASLLANWREGVKWTGFFNKLTDTGGLGLGEKIKLEANIQVAEEVESVAV